MNNFMIFSSQIFSFHECNKLLTNFLFKKQMGNFILLYFHVFYDLDFRWELMYLYVFILGGEIV